MVFLTWIKENHPDLPETMAALDQGIEKLLSLGFKG
jgi:hypothetical protein